jgi:hypothetical protein
MRNQLNFRLLFSAVLVVGLAIFGMNLDHPAHASASGNPIVTVGNTSANPVPTVTQGTTAVSGNVSITGTPNVNVSNVPAVQAQQSGPWTVGINGTPTVNVASLPAVTLTGTPTVNIANGSIKATPAFHVESVSDNVPIQTAKTYTLNSPVNATAIVGKAFGDLELFVNICTVEDCSSTTPVSLSYPAGNIILNFNQPIRTNSILVSNNSAQTSLAFSISVLGD